SGPGFERDIGSLLMSRSPSVSGGARARIQLRPWPSPVQSTQDAPQATPRPTTRSLCVRSPHPLTPCSDLCLDRVLCSVLGPHSHRDLRLDRPALCLALLSRHCSSSRLVRD